MFKSEQHKSENAEYEKSWILQGFWYLCSVEQQFVSLYAEGN